MPIPNVPTKLRLYERIAPLHAAAEALHNKWDVRRSVEHLLYTAMWKPELNTKQAARVRGYITHLRERADTMEKELDEVVAAFEDPATEAPMTMDERSERLRAMRADHFFDSFLPEDSGPCHPRLMTVLRHVRSDETTLGQIIDEKGGYLREKSKGGGWHNFGKKTLALLVQTIRDVGLDPKDLDPKTPKKR